MDLALARERMLNTKGKQFPDPLQLDVTNDLHITAKKIGAGPAGPAKLDTSQHIALRYTKTMIGGKSNASNKGRD